MHQTAPSLKQTDSSSPAMRWEDLLSSRRLPGLETRGDTHRYPFHHDHDKIVFSESFRRLGRKTQVHPLASNDHVHTRLTHSLEAGCVGRSLGMAVGATLQATLPPRVSPSALGSIVQAACLAHDIGNPPFGHAGEYVIRDWFSRPKQAHLLEGLTEQQICDLQTYEGNAQGFRIVTQLEYRLGAGGMNLTAATLGSLLKYPWTSAHATPAGKFCAFESERDILAQTAEELGLLQHGENQWCRHPLAWLVEAADDLCYALLDLEDGMELGMLQFDEVAGILEAIAGCRRSGEPAAMPSGASQQRRIAMLRSAAMERAVEEVAEVFCRHEQHALSGTMPNDLLGLCSPELRDGVQAAKRMARQRIFHSSRKAKLEIGAHTVLGSLLDAFIGAAHELHTTGRSSFKHKRVLTLVGEGAMTPDDSLYSSYRRMLDFIGGMTDRFAVDLSQEMAGGIRGD